MGELGRLIRDVPDFPTPGVLFKDITPLLADADGFASAVALMAQPFADSGVDVVAGVEARGFLFGPAVAQTLGVGFVPIRKPGKLPADTTSVDYALEYGTDTLEVHTRDIGPGTRVAVVDDVLATGGTLAATVMLLESLEAECVGMSVLIELLALDGRSRLNGAVVHAVMQVA